MRGAGESAGARAGLVARRRGTLGGGAEKIERDSALPVSDYGRSKLAGERAASIRRACRSRLCGRASCSVRGTVESMRCSGRSLDRACTSSPGGATNACRSLPWQTSSNASCSRRKKANARARRPGQGIYFAAAEDLSYIELGIAMARALGNRGPASSACRMVYAEIGLAAISCRGSATAGLGRPRQDPDVLAGSWTCSSAKARQQLGWSPEASLADRLRETAQWYRDARWL